MSFHPPKGWRRDSDKLYVHSSGVRIQLATYREKEGWFLIPNDLDKSVAGFEPNSKGRTKAFETFVQEQTLYTGVKIRKKAPAKRAAKTKQPEEEDESEGEGEGGEEKEDDA